MDIRLEIALLNDHAVSALTRLISRYPPFSEYKFGMITPRLIDQLHNRANVIVVYESNAVAYAGWIMVNNEDAKHWTSHGGELPTPNWESGDAIIVTIAVSEHRDFLMALGRGIAKVSAGKKVYRMRTFQDGRSDIRRPPLTARGYRHEE